MQCTRDVTIRALPPVAVYEQDRWDMTPAATGYMSSYKQESCCRSKRIYFTPGSVLLLPRIVIATPSHWACLVVSPTHRLLVGPDLTHYTSPVSSCTPPPPSHPRHPHSLQLRPVRPSPSWTSHSSFILSTFPSRTSLTPPLAVLLQLPPSYPPLSVPCRLSHRHSVY